MMRTFWNDIERQHDEMTDVFNWMHGKPRKIISGSKEFRQPLCSMDWKDNQLHTELELPGVDKKDIDLNVGEGFLEVKVENKEAELKDMRNQFYRKLPLPENVDTRNVIAEFHNGLLKIDIPKIEIDHDTVKIDIR